MFAAKNCGFTIMQIEKTQYVIFLSSKLLLYKSVKTISFIIKFEESFWDMLLL